MEPLVYVLVFWAICAFLGGVIAGQKGAGGKGILLGLLFGPLGVLAAFAMDGRVQCPHCHGRLNGRPRICPHCRHETGLDTSNEARQTPVVPRRRGAEFGVRCAKCKGEVDAPSDAAGQSLKCPACGKPSHLQLFRY